MLHSLSTNMQNVEWFYLVHEFFASESHGLVILDTLKCENQI